MHYHHRHQLSAPPSVFACNRLFFSCIRFARMCWAAVVLDCVARIRDRSRARAKESTLCDGTQNTLADGRRFVYECVIYIFNQQIGANDTVFVPVSNYKYVLSPAQLAHSIPLGALWVRVSHWQHACWAQSIGRNWRFVCDQMMGVGYIAHSI